MSQLPFQDRAEAGRLLAARLVRRESPESTIVLGLPRGGVPVAFQISHLLDAPLDVAVVRKVGVPWQPELAMGAVGMGGFEALDRELIAELGISSEEVRKAAEREREEVRRREKLYRDGLPAPDLRAKTVILADDGLATGASMAVAAGWVRSFRPARIVVAAPVGSAEACWRLKQQADEVVCLATPEPFHAVGEWYVDFRQVSEEEVRELLARRRSETVR